MPLVEEMFRDWEVPRRVYEIESGSNQIQIRQASVSMVKNGDISSNLMCRMEQMTCKPDSNWNESIFLHFVVSNVQVFYCMFSFSIMREKFCISLRLFFFFLFHLSVSFAFTVSFLFHEERIFFLLGIILKVTHCLDYHQHKSLTLHFGWSWNTTGNSIIGMENIESQNQA